MLFGSYRIGWLIHTALLWSVFIIWGTYVAYPYTVFPLGPKAMISDAAHVLLYLKINKNVAFSSKKILLVDEKKCYREIYFSSLLTIFCMCQVRLHSERFVSPAFSAWSSEHTHSCQAGKVAGHPLPPGNSSPSVHTHGQHSRTVLLQTIS